MLHVLNVKAFCSGDIHQDDILRDLKKGRRETMWPDPGLSWWPSCLDGGALINIDAPGCGTLVVRGPTGHK